VLAVLTSDVVVEVVTQSHRSIMLPAIGTKH